MFCAVSADLTESEECIFMVPVVDAILRMAQFIGNKSYTSDFLEDVRLRPYNLDNKSKEFVHDSQQPSELLMTPQVII